MFPALGVGPFLGGVDHLVVVVAVASASGGRRVSPGGSDWAPLGHLQWGRKSKPSAFVFLSPSERRAAAATEKQSEWEDLLYASTSSRREASLNYRCLRKARFLVPSAVE